MPRPAWIAVVALGVAQIALSQRLASIADDRRVTYVFTPLVDVVPGGAPLSAVEAGDLASDAKNQVDARDIQRAFARMGSNISLDDLLRGIEAVEAGPTPLSDAQRKRIGAILEKAKADHQADYAVQEEILGLEATLDGQVQEILAALPEDARARVQARAAQSGPKQPPPGQPGKAP